MFADADDARALIAQLRADRGDRDHKDRIYRELIAELQARGPGALLARNLIWLGLWRGIGAAARRHRRLSHDADELVADIAITFLSVIERCDLATVRRVAATIVMNVDRLLMERRLRAWQIRTRETLLVTITDGPTAAAVPGDVDPLELSIIRRLGRDGDFLLEWALSGSTYSEIARRSGISTTTVRRRVGEARKQLRRQLRHNPCRENANERVSTFSGASRDISDVHRSTALLPDNPRCPNHWPPTSRPGATKRVGTTLYCDACADFLLEATLRHDAALSCVVTSTEGPWICPACLAVVFRLRGETR